MQISLNDIAFTSYDVKVKNNSKEEFKNKVVSFNENMDKTNQNTNELSKNTTSTIFKDPTNEKLVTVSLENSTIEKLQNQFGKNSSIKNENGSVTLNEKAQDFVAGWFADIAYARDYLKADTNSDGILNVNDLNITPAGQSTVGAAGAAAALPASPTTYFKIRVNGVEYVVPAFAVS